MRKKQSQIAGYHLRGDPRNRKQILCFEIKKCFWWRDNQYPMNSYPRITSTHAMPLTTHAYVQNSIQQKMRPYGFERDVFFCYGCVGLRLLPLCLFYYNVYFHKQPLHFHIGYWEETQHRMLVTYSTKSGEGCWFPLKIIYLNSVSKNHYLEDPKNR